MTVAAASVMLLFMQQIEAASTVHKDRAGSPSPRAIRPPVRRGQPSSGRTGGRTPFRLILRGGGFTEPRSHNATGSGTYREPVRSVKSAKVLTRRRRRLGTADSVAARRMLADACAAALR